jgi:hypothetical protein
MLWSQLGAAVQMLENAIVARPQELWDDRSRTRPFWYHVYHTLYFLDLYFSDSPKGFAPPAPFTLSGHVPDGTVPDSAYSREEMRTYLEHGRRKGMKMIEALTDEKALQRCGFSWVDVSVSELVIYNMRHVQHHAAQLNLIHRQVVDSSPGWVFKA